MRKLKIIDTNIRRRKKITKEVRMDAEQRWYAEKENVNYLKNIISLLLKILL